MSGGKVVLHPAHYPAAAWETEFWRRLAVAEEEKKANGETPRFEDLIRHAANASLMHTRTAEYEDQIAAANALEPLQPVLVEAVPPGWQRTPEGDSWTVPWDEPWEPL